MPTLPSPPTSNTPQSRQKVSNGSRPSTAPGFGSGELQRQQQIAGSGGLGIRHAKIRGGGSSEDAEVKAPRAARDGVREKPASKDGTVQRTAKEVEGLKDYVREHPFP